MQLSKRDFESTSGQDTPEDAGALARALVESLRQISEASAVPALQDFAARLLALLAENLENFRPSQYRWLRRSPEAVLDLLAETLNALWALAPQQSYPLLSQALTLRLDHNSHKTAFDRSVLAALRTLDHLPEVLAAPLVALLDHPALRDDILRTLGDLKVEGAAAALVTCLYDDIAPHQGFTHHTDLHRLAWVSQQVTADLHDLTAAPSAAPAPATTVPAAALTVDFSWQRAVQAHLAQTVLARDTAGTSTNTLLRRGVAALVAGNAAEARTLLELVVNQDEYNALGWLALSLVVDTQEERVICLENVQVIDPHNTFVTQQPRAAAIDRARPPDERPDGWQEFASSSPNPTPPPEPAAPEPFDPFSVDGDHDVFRPAGNTADQHSGTFGGTAAQPFSGSFGKPPAPTFGTSFNEPSKTPSSAHTALSWARLLDVLPRQPQAGNIPLTFGRAVQGILSGHEPSGQWMIEATEGMLERDEMAWLWRSTTAPDDETRRICLENVLHLNPSNWRARSGMAQLARAAKSTRVSRPALTSSKTFASFDLDDFDFDDDVFGSDARPRSGQKQASDGLFDDNDLARAVPERVGPFGVRDAVAPAWRSAPQRSHDILTRDEITALVSYQAVCALGLPAATYLKQRLNPSGFFDSRIDPSLNYAALLALHAIGALETSTAQAQLLSLYTPLREGAAALLTALDWQPVTDMDRLAFAAAQGDVAAYASIGAQTLPLLGVWLYTAQTTEQLEPLIRACGQLGPRGAAVLRHALHFGHSASLPAWLDAACWFTHLPDEAQTRVLLLVIEMLGYCGGRVARTALEAFAHTYAYQERSARHLNLMQAARDTLASMV